MEESLNLIYIVAARPTFMKVAPVMNALKTRRRIVQTLIHTGQHYDVNMSGVFLEQLGIPAPDRNPGNSAAVGHDDGSDNDRGQGQAK
jgi:UDP-N-acetylglucosamine 2-epimerase